MLRKNVAGQFVCFQGVSASTGGILTGATWTMRRCLDGTFAAGGATITEDSTNGWYKAALTQADTNGNNVSYNFTATGAIPQTINDTTTACDPTAATNFGITGIPAVASGSAGALLIDGTGTAAISNSSGKVLLQATQSGVTIPTVTTVTNQLTAAAIATGVWQDTTAGDFTTSLSIGKSILNGVSLGTGLTVNDLTTKSGFSLTGAQSISSLAISGNMTMGNLTNNGTTTLSGAVSLGSTLGVTGATTLTGAVTATNGGNSITGVTAAVTGNVTVGTNNDKTGYALTAAYDAAKTAAAATDIVSAGAITTSGGVASADVKKVNAVTVNGAGTGGSPWGP